MCFSELRYLSVLLELRLRLLAGRELLSFFITTRESSDSSDDSEGKIGPELTEALGTAGSYVGDKSEPESSPEFGTASGRSFFRIDKSFEWSTRRALSLVTWRLVRRYVSMKRAVVTVLFSSKTPFGSMDGCARGS